MPTRHARIPVVDDPELSDALQRVAPYFPRAARSRVVHDLAVKGAEATLEEKRAAGEAIEQLVSISTERGGPIDRKVLQQIDELAWDE